MPELMVQSPSDYFNRSSPIDPRLSTDTSPVGKEMCAPTLRTHCASSSHLCQPPHGAHLTARRSLPICILPTACHIVSAAAHSYNERVERARMSKGEKYADDAM